MSNHIPGYSYGKVATSPVSITDLGADRKRFGQWILDLCRRPYDQDWFNLPPLHQRKRILNF